MQKTTYFILFLALAAGSASCAKTNKRKFSNDWKVTYDEEFFTTGGGADFWTYSVVLENGTATLTSDFAIDSTFSNNTQSGPVVTNTFTIKKDGTWLREKTYELIQSNTKSTHLNTSSGTWSFLGKSRSEEEDFRRRDRVIFTVLKRREHSEWYDTESGEHYTMSDEDFTADSGLETMIYVITESKHKELHLEREGTNTFGSDSGYGSVPILERNRLVLKAE